MFQCIIWQFIFVAQDYALNWRFTQVLSKSEKSDWFIHFLSNFIYQIYSWFVWHILPMSKLEVKLPLNQPVGWGVNLMLIFVYPIGDFLEFLVYNCYFHSLTTIFIFYLPFQTTIIVMVMNKLKTRNNLQGSAWHEYFIVHQDCMLKQDE